MTEMETIKERLSLLDNTELVTILRDHDENEWQPEVFDTVRAILNERGISPDTFVGEEDTTTETMENFDLVTMASYTSYLDAETDRLALESKGITVWILDELSPLGEGMNPGIRLQVREEDVIKALQILQSGPIPSSDLPEEIAEPPCPKCGSRNVMEQVEVQEPTPAFLTPTTEQAYFYTCSSCGHKWLEQ
jgi:hypothetical protein